MTSLKPHQCASPRDIGFEYSKQRSESMDDIDQDIIDEIMEDYHKNKELIEEYRRSKEMPIETSPKLAPVESILFQMVKPALNIILYRCFTENSFFIPRTSFNGLDYLSEYCYNSNPKYPERKNNWTHIFDMDWVKDYLEKHPRPYYPISLLMSKNTAATYIQAHLRGYWVRRKMYLKEIRKFWKMIKLGRDANGMLAVKKYSYS